MKRLSFRSQRTLARPAEVQGVGYLTGKDVQVCFRPAPACTGVVFVRTDLGPNARIPAHLDQVSGTQRRTTLGQPPLSVGLVEHILAALAGLHIDNCLIELNAPEPPGLDGSAKGFVDVLHQAGTRILAARRAVWTVDEPILVRHNDATLALHPGQDRKLRISYLLDYGPRSPIARQTHTATITPETFANDIACCRTFVLEDEIQALRQQGLGARTKVTDLLVFGPHGPIDNTLRFADEPARHKILDLVGDLSLLGHDLSGHVVAYRSGHPLNIELGRQLHHAITSQSSPRAAA